MDHWFMIRLTKIDSIVQKLTCIRYNVTKFKTGNGSGNATSRPHPEPVKSAI